MTAFRAQSKQTKQQQRPVDQSEERVAALETRLSKLETSTEQGFQDVRGHIDSKFSKLQNSIELLFTNLAGNGNGLSHQQQGGAPSGVSSGGVVHPTGPPTPKASAKRPGSTQNVEDQDSAVISDDDDGDDNGDYDDDDDSISKTK